MEQKEKDLLLKDLCARLPYGVKVQREAQDYSSTLIWVDANMGTVGRKADKIGIGEYWGSIEFIKPYLRTMSSMTEEEESEYHGLCYPEWNNGGLDGGNWHYHNTISSIDWLNAHHIDYRNLIEKGLAIEVTEENNPYRQ